MKATFYEAKEALQRPRNLLALSTSVIASAVIVELTSYVVWRRFVIPTLLLITGRIIHRIGKKRLKTSPVSLLVCMTGKGTMWVAGAMLIGAFLDSIFFAEVPQIVYWILVCGFATAGFQASRLEMRLMAATPEDIAVITDSSDVVRARLKDSIKKNDAVLLHVAPLMEKVGLPALN